MRISTDVVTEVLMGSLGNITSLHNILLALNISGVSIDNLYIKSIDPNETKIFKTFFKKIKEIKKKFVIEDNSSFCCLSEVSINKIIKKINPKTLKKFSIDLCSRTPLLRLPFCESLEELKINTRESKVIKLNLSKLNPQLRKIKLTDIYIGSSQLNAQIAIKYFRNLNEIVLKGNKAAVGDIDYGNIKIIKLKNVAINSSIIAPNSTLILNRVHCDDSRTEISVKTLGLRDEYTLWNFKPGTLKVNEIDSESLSCFNLKKMVPFMSLLRKSNPIFKGRYSDIPYERMEVLIDSLIKEGFSCDPSLKGYLKEIKGRIENLKRLDRTISDII